MKISVLGSGGIALSHVVSLTAGGHVVTLWSPSGRGTESFAGGEPVVARGLLEGEAWPRIGTDIAGVVSGADAVIIALRGNGHRPVMDRLAPCLRAGQAVIVSSQYSLSALYLAKLMHARGVEVLIAAWGTTAVTAHRSGNVVNVTAIRQKIDVAAVPARATPRAMALCTELFGDRFESRDDVLAIALSNLNPPIHMANCLCNLSRIERGEDWEMYGMVTPSIGRLIEALDAERLALAEIFGLRVRSVFVHLALSFDLPVAATVQEMQNTLNARRPALGPKTAAHRHIDEDLPFGIVPLVRIGEIAGLPMKLHAAGVTLMSGLRGRDLAAENDLLPAMDFGSMTAEQFHRVAREGWAR